MFIVSTLPHVDHGLQFPLSNISPFITGCSSEHGRVNGSFPAYRRLAAKNRRMPW